MSLPRENVTLSWPAPSLPGICARTGLPTRDGVVLTPRGAAYDGAEVIVPFSHAAQLRQRALGRLAIVAGIATVGLLVAAIAAAGFLYVPAAAAAAVFAYATRDARRIGVRPVLHGRELLIPGVHPAFAAAVTQLPERCGGLSGGGCETCTSSCVPQVVTV